MITCESTAARCNGVVLEADAPAPLFLHNLLNDLVGLAAFLPAELRQRCWLNAYLLAAGMHQILADYLHRDPYAMNRVAKHLSRVRQPLGSVAARVARGSGAAAWSLRNHTPRTLALLCWQADLTALLQQLAEWVVCQDAVAPPWEELLAHGERLLARAGNLPASVRQSTLRLPSCFHSYDQQPADLARIVHDFAQGWPNRHRPLLVAGVRTSGSYLAPLLAALLKSEGYTSVQVFTLRPGQRLLQSERSMLSSVHRLGGLALLTDDPPKSGGSLRRAAAGLEQIGFSHQSIVLLLQLFGTRASLPEPLRQYPSVLLPWEDWTVQQKLKPAAVRSTLAALLGCATAVGEVERIPLPFKPAARDHARALYRVQLTDRESGRRREQPIYVHGTGLGYFGEHAVAVERRLRTFVPQVYGRNADLLYRAWLPDDRRITSASVAATDTVAAQMVAYTIARNELLAVDEDVSLRLVNRHPVWQRSSDILSQAFGRVAPLARPALHRTAQRLLWVEQPSVIDGGMDAAQWFAGEGTGEPLRKVGFHGHAFSNLDMFCYDPVFDLAGAAASWPGDHLPQALRIAYETTLGKPIDEERWLLYQVAYLQEMMRNQGSESPALHRAMARVTTDYYGKRFFGNVLASARGPMCAIDIDGVLETEALGFPAITPAGCLSLWALTRHGYRPVLVTGRSLNEVRERCSAFALAGGVAEYGAVIYDARSGRVCDLLSVADRANLDRLRGALRRLQGVLVDPAYSYAVRAYRIDRTGRRRSLCPEVIATALAESGVQERLCTIPGYRQTDFMVAGVDKGTGIRALLGVLGIDEPAAGAKPLALAIGDTVTDLPMLALARFACVPGNAGSDLHLPDIQVMRGQYQAGAAQAASLLLGHRPGRCSICRAPRLPAGASLLFTALAAQDTGRWGKLKQVALLAAKVHRA